MGHITWPRPRPFWRRFVFHTQTGCVVRLCTKFEADWSIRSKVIQGSRNYETRSRDSGHAHLWVVLWSVLREAPSCMSVPNLKRIALFIQKLLGRTRPAIASHNLAPFKRPNFAPLQTLFSGGAGRPKFNQLEMVTTCTYRPVWWRSMHAISSYRGYKTPPTRPPAHPLQTHTQTGPITIHCSARLSPQCKDHHNVKAYRRGLASCIELTSIHLIYMSIYNTIHLVLYITVNFFVIDWRWPVLNTRLVSPVGSEQQ